MGLLDRFRRARWQHPDATVRLTAVRELGADQHDVLVMLARQDVDAQVRKVALRRLDDVALLTEAARGDSEPAVRKEAAERLVEVLVDAREAADVEGPLAVLGEPRHLAALAREARTPALREAALQRLEDPRTLAGVARHAADPATRAAAVARIADPAVVGDLALKSEHKEVALAALERVQDTELLRAVAARGRSKAAVKRARARLDAMPSPPPAPSPEKLQARVADLVKRAETLSGAAYPARLADELADLRDQWSDVAAAAEPAAAERFAAALDRVEQEWQRLQAATAEERRLANERARALAERVALCETVEALELEVAPQGLEEARASWEKLPALEGEDAAALARRFEQAEAAFRERMAAAEARARSRGRAEEICAELEQLAPRAERHPRWGALRHEWQELEAQGPADAALADRVARAVAAHEAVLAESRRQREAKAKENLARLEALAGRLEALAQAAEPPLRDVERSLREARNALDQTGPLPTPVDRERVLARLKAGRAALYPKAQELRETDEWKRWANAGVREDLCRRLEALAAVEELPEVSRQFGEILKAWGDAAEVPRTDAEALRARFHAAREAVRARVEAHRGQVKDELQKNLEKKRELVTRAEALADVRPLGKAAEQMRALQQEWKAIGPVPRRDSEALWQQFRTAAGRVFETRKEEADKRKSEWAANLEKKEALVARAEALSTSTEWEAAAAELKKLQAEWKTIGPVRKSQSEVVWQRFRAAADTFFGRYKNRGELEQAARDQQREDLCRQIEALVGTEGAAPEPPPDLASQVQSIVERWNRTPRPRGADPIGDRFYAARDRLLLAYPQAFAGTDLDVEANQGRLEKLCARVEALLETVMAAEGTPEGESPAQALATRWREALAARTMGAAAEEEARRRAAAEEVESARQQWRRVGPVPGEAGRELSDRFRRACDRVTALLPEGAKSLPERGKSLPEPGTGRRKRPVGSGR